MAAGSIWITVEIATRAKWTRDLAQDDPQSDADAAVSAAGDDRAFRRAFATALVGPNFLLLEGLKGILSAAGFRVVAAASRVNDLVLGAELQSQPILLVVDAGDDLRSAVGHIELFKERHENGRVVVLADPGQQSEIPAVFRAGANGYLFMSGPSLEPLIKALELVMLGETVLPKAILPLILEREDEMGRSTSRGLRAAALAPGEIDPAPFGRRPHQQSHRDRDRHRASDRQGSRQIDPFQDRRRQSHAGRHMGDEQWLVRWRGKRQKQSRAITGRAALRLARLVDRDLVSCGSAGSGLSDADVPAKFETLSTVDMRSSSPSSIAASPLPGSYAIPSSEHGSEADHSVARGFQG